jgi:hypothetical protein
MSVIQIREQGVVENGFEVSLYIDGQDYGQVVVRAPFTDQPQKDADLTWYFEKWLRMPFVDKVRANTVRLSKKCKIFQRENAMFRLLIGIF